MANGQLRGRSPFLVSAFSFQHFSFCQSVALGGFARISAFHFLLSAFAWRSPGRAFARWMLDVGCWMLDVGCWMFDVGCSMLDVRCWMFDVGCSMLDVRCWMFDVGCSMLDVRCWMFD